MDGGNGGSGLFAKLSWTEDNTFYMDPVTSLGSHALILGALNDKRRQGIKQGERLLMITA